MEKYSIPAGGNQKIALTVSGNLVYKGWDRPEVEARGSSSENLSLEENDGVIRVECRSDCTVQAPRELAVDCQSIGGDATFKSLDGELTVAEVSGSLNLRAVGATNIDTVRGSLYARDISGNSAGRIGVWRHNRRGYPGRFRSSRQLLWLADPG